MSTCGDLGGRNRKGKPCPRREGWGTGVPAGPCSDHAAAVAEATKIAENRERQTRTTAAQNAFLVAMSLTGNISASARAAGVDRGMHYDWLTFDTEYAERFKEAKAEAIEVLETEARRRAIEGLVTYKFTQSGKPIKHPVTGEPYFEHKVSDTLLIFLLKAEAPEKYRDQLAVTGVQGGAPIKTETEHSVSGRTMAELVALRSAALANAAGSE